MKNNVDLAKDGLIQAALDAEATLGNLLSKNQITGLVTRMPLEKLIAAISAYKQVR